MGRQLNRIAMTLAVLAIAGPARAQVDQERARRYFEEVRVLCERDAGRLWGVSLCGPIAIADPATHTIATNQPAPDAKPPSTLGFANAAVEWGGTRWSTLSWPLLPQKDADRALRDRLILHELFHRVQPQLGLLILPDLPNDHLDTLDGRYWMLLEWRALTAALSASGRERSAAVADALAFRAARFREFPGAAESERVLEINEGLPEYTAIAVWATSPADAAKAATSRIAMETAGTGIVRTFPYSIGAAYGVLLDAVSPGWTHRVKASDRIASMLAEAMKVDATTDVDASAARYDAAALRRAEEAREVEKQKRVADFRRRFVDGPVLTLPAGRSASFRTDGMTPLPGAGTVYPTYRTTSDWGTLTADFALLSTDRRTITVPAPQGPVTGSTLAGDGWTLTLADAWTVLPGARAGDYAVVRKESAIRHHQSEIINSAVSRPSRPR